MIEVIIPTQSDFQLYESPIKFLYEQNQEEIKEYTVTFVDYNGNILKEEQVKEGQDATAPTNPNREGYKLVRKIHRRATSLL